MLLLMSLAFILRLSDPFLLCSRDMDCRTILPQRELFHIQRIKLFRGIVDNCVFWCVLWRLVMNNLLRTIITSRSTDTEESNDSDRSSPVGIILLVCFVGVLIVGKIVL